MIGGVADQMQKRVAHVFENLPVQLGIATLHLDGNPLSQMMGGVTHHPRDFRPNRLDRLHPRFQHIVLKRGGHLVQALQNTAQVIAVMGRQQQLIASQHQFANRGQQMLQHLNPNPHRRRRRRGFVQCRGAFLGGRRAGREDLPGDRPRRTRGGVE